MDDPEFQAWSNLWEAHCETQEHEDGFAAVYDPWQARRDELEPKFDAIIKNAEKRSAVTCELCPAPGRIRGHNGWSKTLCDGCAERGGWV